MSETVSCQLEDLQSAGVIDHLDVRLATELCHLAATCDDLALAAVALTARATRERHVCLDLATPPDFVSEHTLAWPGLQAWQTALADSRLVTGQACSPLVLEDGRLYLQRFHDHETRLAAELLTRATSIEVDASALADGLERFFAGGGDQDRQRQAAATAARSFLTVITGGPGTGKTTTVARILALLAGLPGRARFHARLLAPTGKAASRLAESLREQRDQLGLAPAELARLPEDATTIHSALGRTHGSSPSFRHGLLNPLPDDVVVVDEASMVDVALMRRLVEAVRPDAGLILLGDRNQLASVESGAVLGEICTAAEHTASPLRHHVVELQKSWRFDAASSLGRLALAIRDGDGPRATEAIGADSATALIAKPDNRDLVTALGAVALDAWRPLSAADHPDRAVAALSEFKILAGHRSGPWGVERLNERIRTELRRAGKLQGRGTLAAGTPVLVTENDYRIRLFNGDQGVLVRTGEGVRAAFATPSGDVRLLSPTRLPGWEPAWAMTIHKSQGSEYERVIVVLPELGSPLLTRELLYTAVTRARTEVTIVGSTDEILAAVDNRHRRVSGLAGRLRHPATIQPWRSGSAAAPSVP